jgi:cobalamin biosynthesis protein CobT
MSTKPIESGLEQIKDMLDNKKTKKRAGKTIIYAPICTSSDGFFPPFSPSREADPWWYEGNREDARREFTCHRDELGAKVATMRRKLEQALITKTRSEWVGGRSGKLDVRKRGVGIMRADDKIFRKLEEADAIDTCVSLLVDCSGSMRSRDRMETAAKTAIAIAIALDGAGIPVEVLGHTAVPHADSKLDYEARYGKGKWARRDAVRIFEFKTYDKTMRQSIAEMGTIASMALAHNADPDAYLMVAHRLAKRAEKRKVMMVLADGHPEHVTDLTDHELSQQTRKAVVTCCDMGIDMVGVGIQYDGLKEFFPDYVVVRNMDDLSREVMDRLAKLLLGNRFHIDNSALINVAS